MKEVLTAVPHNYSPSLMREIMMMMINSFEEAMN
jgi:hypothetical protein